MRIVFSRKGFDSSAGGGPSPIVNGRPFSLPIPAYGSLSRTSYADLGLGDHAVRASRGRLGAEDLCHHDPMFLPGERAMLGQCSAAQSHLENEGVGVGDLFVFFGLFQAAGEHPHHRLFGWMRVAEILPVAEASPARLAQLASTGMPHALGMHARNDTVWMGPGGTAKRASAALRLTVPEGPPSVWRVPAWLPETGLSYHRDAARWLPGDRLRSAPRGQEFVADVGERADARAWAERIVGEMRG
ncbi:Nmad3 family putative nucleotide modification protein [Aurantiacibacter spongiae]|uniref:Nucleotide modification associated domain-containing protein n=1 Tax=Aurantiacibacter spongiae TaxID=2488860 RepID=A0A3N5DKA6_9SPHN|nr:hypothetical protein [Aurantiacibacter spongiae]RPF71195.1 hypothetical protein EG799_05905 [Aurantiacibacter spongiae]